MPSQRAFMVILVNLLDAYEVGSRRARLDSRYRPRTVAPIVETSA